jgi:hypothetical protein
MRRLLQRARELPEERKSALAAIIAGSCTAIVVLVWGLSFMDVVAEAEPALAAQSPAGPVSSLLDQMKALFDQVEIPPIISTTTEPVPFDQAN